LMLAASIVPKPSQMYFILPQARHSKARTRGTAGRIDFAQQVCPMAC
jgi:hypothetical protein